MKKFNNKYVNPTLDWSFKRIFLSPGHDEVLKTFLNDVLKGELVVDEIENIQNGGGKNPKKEKNTYFDVVCKDTRGRRFIIEMQRKDESDLLKRMDFYRSRILTDQLSSGEEYSALMPVIVIAVCDFAILRQIFGSKANGMYFERIGLTGRISGLDVENTPPLFVILDLPAYRMKGFPHSSELEDWFALFTCHSNDNEDVHFRRKPLTLALDLLEFEALPKDERMKAEIDIFKARKEFSEFKAAELKGVAKGEHRKALETAKNFLEMGLSLEQIAKGTGLTVKEIKALKKAKAPRG